jgi:AIG2-like family
LYFFAKNDRVLTGVNSQNNLYKNVRTYTVVNKLPEEAAPNDWYFNVVFRGAFTCGLPEEYCWHLFHLYVSLATAPSSTANRLKLTLKNLSLESGRKIVLLIMMRCSLLDFHYLPRSSRC